MSRKPMSEEQKKKLSEQAKARAAVKKGEVKRLSLGEHLANVQAARDAVVELRRDNPDVVEAKQALDALESSVYAIGQLKNTLASR